MEKFVIARHRAGQFAVATKREQLNRAVFVALRSSQMKIVITLEMVELEA